MVLLGQSMGATATTVVAAQPEFSNKIPCILLWVPDSKEEIHIDPDKIYEEAGQLYTGQFWLEASKADFMKCLDMYKGGIHLVYGEHDKYVSQENRNKVIAQVKAKNQPVLVLPGQDHSPWDYDMAQKVYQEELTFLKKYL